MTSGRVLSITNIDRRGDSLASDVADTDTVIEVLDATDFDENDNTRRWLVIGDGTPVAYVDVDDESTPNTVTLAAPIGAAYEEGLPVDVWDPFAPPAGARVAEYLAAVDIPARGVHPGVVVPQKHIPAAGINNLVGASVALESDDDDESWEIAEVLGRVPVLDVKIQSHDTAMWVDDDDVPRTLVGEQVDGTFTTIDVNGPPPPTPAEPGVADGAGILIVTSYGLTADLSAWPLDFARFDVHVGAPGFVHSIASKVADFTVDGGAVTVALDAGDYEALIVAVNTSGAESPESARVSGTVLPPTIGAGGVKTYLSDTAPVGLDADDDGALWFDTDADNLQSRWNGATLEWEAMPIGPGATAPDIVAGKKVPLDHALSLEWGVPNPADAPWELLASLMPRPSTPELFDAPNGLVDDDDRWVSLSSGMSDGVRYLVRPYFIDKATGAVSYGPTLAEPTVEHGQYGIGQGITRIGTRWYVLVGTPADLSVYVFEDDWTFVESWAIDTGAFFGTIAAPATDGTNLVVALTTGTGNKIRHYSPAGALVSEVDISGIAYPAGASEWRSIAYGSFDLGAPRYVLGAGDSGSNGRAVVLNAAGVEQTGESFDLGAASPYGLAWDASAGLFVVLGFGAALWETTTDLTSRTTWGAYTLRDSIVDGGLHETAPSPIAGPVTIPPRLGLRMGTAAIPELDDDQAPNTIGAYVRVGTAPSSPADLFDASAAQGYGMFASYWFVPAPNNTGNPPPAASTFPVGPSGELPSEVGGFVVRGDGTGDWPYLIRRVLDQADGRYAGLSHEHLELAKNVDVVPRFEALEADVAAAATAADVAALDARVDALEAADTALDARVDALETGTPAVQLTPTMSGVSGHAFYIKKIAPGVVAVSGYVDVDDADGSRRDTGMRIPAGWEPPAQLIVSAPIVGGGDANYRYYFNTDGTIEFQQDGNTEGPFEGITALWFTA